MQKSSKRENSQILQKHPAKKTAHHLLLLYALGVAECWCTYQPDYSLLLGPCSVEQECIHIKECPYTLVKFKQILSTSNPDEKNRLIKTMTHNVASCGELSDRTVCCDIDKGKKVWKNWGKNNILSIWDKYYFHFFHKINIFSLKKYFLPLWHAFYAMQFTWSQKTMQVLKTLVTNSL